MRFFRGILRNSCAFRLSAMITKGVFYWVMNMSKGKYDKESSIELLRNKQVLLRSQGIERYPQRSDFTDEEVVAIKAFLGPWPRALEAAGLKPPRDDGRPQRTKEKRIRAKRSRIAALKKQQKESKTQSDKDGLEH